MHKTTIIAAAIVGASSLVADLIFSAKTFFRHKKMLTKLCNENADLHQKNTHLQAQLATYQHRQAKLYAEKLKKEEELSKNAEELRDTKDKLKSAHDHISVLRAEIIKLNRKLNQRKRRG